MTTDGACWYVKDDGHWVAHRVLDYRMPLLYALYLKSIGIPYLDTEDGHEDANAYIMHDMRDEILFMPGLRGCFCEDCPDVQTDSAVERFRNRRNTYRDLQALVTKGMDLKEAYWQLHTPYAQQDWVWY